MKATLPFQKNHSRLHIANLTLLMALAFCTLLPSGARAQQLATTQNVNTSSKTPADSWVNQTGIFSRYTPNRYSANGIYSGYSASEEDKSARSRDSKCFSHGDGVNDLFYIGALHYKNEQGYWSDIDVTVKKSDKEGFAFENTTNSFKTYYASNVADGLQMSREGYDFGWGKNLSFSLVKNASTAGTALTGNGRMSRSDFRTLKATNYAPGINVEWVQMGAGVETGYWIRNKSAYQNATSGYLMTEQELVLPAGCYLTVDGKRMSGDFTASSFEVKLPSGLTGLAFKQVSIYDSYFTYDDIMKDVEMGTMAARYDKNGKPLAEEWDGHKLEVQYDVVQSNGTVKVRFLIPVQWLNNPDRIFPIYVDPYVYADGVTTGSSTCTDSYALYYTCYHDSRWEYS